MKEVLDLVAFIFLLIIGSSFLLLPSRILRRVYPGWPRLERRMWKSRFCNWLLLHLVGKSRYQRSKEEWLR